MSSPSPSRTVSKAEGHKGGLGHDGAGGGRVSEPSDNADIRPHLCSTSQTQKGTWWRQIRALSGESGPILRCHLVWEKEPLVELRLSVGSGHVAGGQPRRTRVWVTFTREL